MLNTKNFILDLIKKSQAYKDNGNVDSLIDENLQEISYLNNGIIAITQAQKAISATMVAFDKAFSLLNSAFLDIQTLQSQIDVCETEKAMAEKEAKRRGELGDFLYNLDSEMKLADLF